MPATIIIGNYLGADNYVKEYAQKFNIPDYQTKKMTNGLTISDAREIKKTLSFSSSNERLFVISGQVTFEAQNSLLKSIEDADIKTHFIFCQEMKEDLLPTIHSRCKIVLLRDNFLFDLKLNESILDLLSGKINYYSQVDMIYDLCKNDVSKMLYSLRGILIDESIDDYQKSQAFGIIKKLLMFLPLVEKNNVSHLTILDKVFTDS